MQAITAKHKSARKHKDLAIYEDSFVIKLETAKAWSHE